MKRFYLLIFILLTTSVGYAQEGIQSPRPGHALDTLVKGPRIMADEIHYRTTDQGGVTGSTKIYKRSADGLSDTIQIMSGSIPAPMVYLYSKENRLETVKMDMNYDGDFDNDGAKEEYSYNESGWLTSKTTFFGKSSSETTYYDYSDLAYTDSGYIWKNKEYILDSQSRLLRSGNIRYTYIDQGYIQHDTIDRLEGNTIVKIPREIEYLFEEHGYLAKETCFLLSDKGEWEFNYSIEATYTFSDNPQSNAPFFAEPQSVFGVEGGIVVTTQISHPVCIYSIGGQLIKRVYTQPHESISMPKGIYIVTAGKESQKVVVR